MAANRLTELPSLARLPGIGRSRRYDLRFSWALRGGPRGKSLLEVFEKAATRPIGQSAIAERIAGAVTVAARFDFGEELVSIAEALAARVAQREDARDARIKVFLASFGLGGVDSRIDAIGAELGVSGSRVSQLLAPMKEQLDQVTVWSPAVELFLTRLARAPGTTLEEKLAGERAWLCGTDIADLWKFAEDVLKLPSDLKDGIETGHDVDQCLGGSAAAMKELALALRRPVDRAITRCGVAHVHHVLGRAVVDGHLDRVTADAARAALTQIPGVVFLGRDKNWLTIAPVGEGVLLSRIGKLLKVASRGMPMVDIYEALCADHKWWHEHFEEHPMPPPSILGEWLALVPWIERTAGGKLRMKANAQDFKLSELEAKVLQSLEARGGLALVAEVVQDCTAAGLNADSARVTLVTSVFVRQVVLGIHALRGREIARARFIEALAGLELINAARQRRHI